MKNTFFTSFFLFLMATFLSFDAQAREYLVVTKDHSMLWLIDKSSIVQSNDGHIEYVSYGTINLSRIEYRPYRPNANKWAMITYSINCTTKTSKSLAFYLTNFNGIPIEHRPIKTDEESIDENGSAMDNSYQVLCGYRAPILINATLGDIMREYQNGGF